MKSPQSKYLPNGSKCCNVSNPNPNNIENIKIFILLSVFKPQIIVNIVYIHKWTSLSSSNNLNLGTPKSGTGTSERMIKIKV